ncbi:MAG: glycosyltransferase [Coriobacteriales bacterium]
MQRVAKLAHYLPEWGWSPYVVTATPVWGRPTDESLLEQVDFVPVERIPNRDPSALVARALAPAKRMHRRRTRPTDSQAPRTSTNTGWAPLSTRVVRAFWLDAAARWAAEVPRAAARLHACVGFDAVLASGPPHSALVAGAYVAKVLDLPLVADVRDPWVSNPAYRWPESPRRDARSLALEREVMHRAAAAVCVSEPISAEALEYGAPRAITVPNGFDRADLPAWAPLDGPARIAFMGRFYASTDPTPFFDGVACAVEQHGPASDVIIDIVGPESDHVTQIIRARALDDHVVRHGFLPHRDALGIVSHADAGLVVLADRPGAEAIYTGKLFEYLGIGLPVLLVGPPDGAAAHLVRDAHAGTVVPYGDATGVAAALNAIAHEKRSGASRHAPVESVIERFDRRLQVRTVAALLDEVVS